MKWGKTIRGPKRESKKKSRGPSKENKMGVKRDAWGKKHKKRHSVEQKGWKGGDLGWAAREKQDDSIWSGKRGAGTGSKAKKVGNEKTSRLKQKTEWTNEGGHLSDTVPVKPKKSRGPLSKREEQRKNNQRKREEKRSKTRAKGPKIEKRLLLTWERPKKNGVCVGV